MPAYRLAWALAGGTRGHLSLWSLEFILSLLIVLVFIKNGYESVKIVLTNLNIILKNIESFYY